MKKLLTIMAVLLGAVSLAQAETYSMAGSWQDDTAAGPNYVPKYKAEWRVNGGTATVVDNLSAPAFTVTVTAAPASIIEARVVNCNVLNASNPICGPWNPWIQATAPYVPVTPAAPSGFSIVITPQ